MGKGVVFILLFIDSIIIGVAVGKLSATFCFFITGFFYRIIVRQIKCLNDIIEQDHHELFATEPLRKLTRKAI